MYEMEYLQKFPNYRTTPITSLVIFERIGITHIHITFSNQNLNNQESITEDN